MWFCANFQIRNCGLGILLNCVKPQYGVWEFEVYKLCVLVSADMSIRKFIAELTSILLFKSMERKNLNI
jgi:hypothetical protein